MLTHILALRPQLTLGPNTRPLLMVVGTVWPSASTKSWSRLDRNVHSLDPDDSMCEKAQGEGREGVCVCVRGGIMILQLADDGQHCLAPSINKVMIKVGQERPQLGALGGWEGGGASHTIQRRTHSLASSQAKPVATPFFPWICCSSVAHYSVLFSPYLWVVRRNAHRLSARHPARCWVCRLHPYGKV
jgi:hypothetical protein